MLIVLVGMCLLTAVIGQERASANPSACQVSELAAQVDLIAGSQAAGSVSYSLRIENHSANTCTLGSHLGLGLLGKSALPLPTHVQYLGRGTTVKLTAGHSASAQLRFSADIPGPGEPQRGACEPRAQKVRVGLGGLAQGSLLAQVKPATSVCEHGTIAEQPLKAST